MTKEEILNTLDNSHDGYYCAFVELGHVYAFLIDARLNVFRGENGRWAIAAERLGYHPRAGAIVLDISFYGNCLTNLDLCNGRPTNCYSIYPVDSDSFSKTTDGESVKPDAEYWLVRGRQVSLSHHQQDYTDAGIELKAYEPDGIRIEETGRLVVSQHQDLFRATDSELYKSIPADLKKILVLDEWFHQDFQLQISPPMTEEHVRQAFELNQRLTGLGGMTFEHFAQVIRQQEIKRDDWNRKVWENSRPSSSETWKLIASVIASNDSNEYKPTLEPNTHWKNWPDSGSL
ncbi:MAG: hypothetical protein NW241_04965 [Bacteroidia bacterium]|nr:hypothetical protein [Bacteroidia bacterium]